MLIKRSITINKHRTSLSLESEFWEAIKIISKIKNCSIESLITQIDLNRKTSLASSTRVFLLQFFILETIFIASQNSLSRDNEVLCLFIVIDLFINI